MKKENFNFASMHLINKHLGEEYKRNQIAIQKRQRNMCLLQLLIGKRHKMRKTSSPQLTFFIGTYLYRFETKKDTGT